MSAWEKVDRVQCPDCRYRRRCPARRILLQGGAPDPMALHIMRDGTCTQYEWDGRTGGDR